MEMEFQEKLDHRYMVLSSEKITYSDYQTHMLQENQIHGLLGCTVKKIDDKELYTYDVTGKVSLNQLVSEKKITAVPLQSFFDDMTNMFREIRGYLLQEDSILLKPDYIYSDHQMKQFYFCCFPGNELILREELQELGEFLLTHIDHNDSGAVRLGYSFYQKIMDGAGPGTIDDAGVEGFFGNTGPADKKQEDEDELFREDEERKQLLDDFFSREDEEEKLPVTGKGLLLAAVWILSTGILAAAAVIAGYAFGYFEAGIAGAVLILVISVLCFARKKPEEETEVPFGNDPRDLSESVFDNNKTGEDDDLRSPYVREETQSPYVREETQLPYVREETQRSNMREDNQSPYMRENIRNIYMKESANMKEDIRSREYAPSGRVSSQWSRELGDMRTTLLSPADQQRDNGQPDAKLIFRNLMLPDIRLTKPVYFIGKSQTAADIVIPSPEVSRMHARIDMVGKEYQIFDLNSRNGTYVNGRRISNGERLSLRHNDEIRFGEIILMYQAPAAACDPDFKG